MRIQDFLTFIETHVNQAIVDVNLLQIARNSFASYPGREPNISLVIDAESCLDRLYGGYYTDWVCGGQWNRMIDYLSNLSATCQDNGIKLVVFFDGTFDRSRTCEWVELQIEHRRRVNQVLKHINTKSTPPPKIWWSPPAGIVMALKCALQHLGIKVAASVEDHHQEVIKFIRCNRFIGLVACNAMFSIFDPPRYFLSQSLKLTFKGSLEIKEILLDEAARQIDLNPDRFCVLAALMGNHILTADSLQPFYKQLMLEHAKEKRDEKLSEKELSATDRLITAIITFVREQETVDDLDKICEIIFASNTPDRARKSEQFKESVRYYFKGTPSGFVKYGATNQALQGKISGSPAKEEKESGSCLQNGESVEGTNESGYASPQTLKDSDTGDKQKASDDKKSFGKAPGSFVERDRTGASSSGTSLSPLPAVPSEVLKIATERHTEGVMSPWVLHLLTKGELRLPVVMESEQDSELPLSIDVYRPLRANAYAVLFSIKPYRKMKGGEEPPPQPEVYIKENSVIRPTHGSLKPNVEVVRATPLDWLTPSLKRLWLGTQMEDKDRRLRAFLSCLQSDSPLMVNPACVPPPLLMACCVLRYLLQHRRPILRKHELDAFLSTMLSSRLRESAYTQDLQLPMVSPRAVQLAALFMCGVEHAVFVNDVCGAPLPLDMCGPWLCMDGKLLHLKLLKSSNSSVSLLELCDRQMEQMMAVERMEQAILEGLNVDFAKLPLPMQLPNFQRSPPRMSSPRFPGSANSYGPPDNFGGPSVGRGRGKGLLGKSDGLDGRGGQLEVAGMVVGSWGASKAGRGAGRGYQQQRSVSQQQYRSPGTNYQPAGASATQMSVTSVKNRVRGKTNPIPGARGPSVRQAYNGRPGSSGRLLQNQSPRAMGRGLTVEHIDSGASLPGASSTQLSHGLLGSSLSQQHLESAAAQLTATRIMDAPQSSLHMGLQHSQIEPTSVQMPSSQYHLQDISGSLNHNTLGISSPLMGPVGMERR